MSISLFPTQLCTNRIKLQTEKSVQISKIFELFEEILAIEVDERQDYVDFAERFLDT